MAAFWRRTAGPPALGPYQTARYTVVAPSFFAMLSSSNGFQVLGFARAADSFSRTHAYVASPWRVVLQPAAINAPVAVGQSITVHAVIVGRLDQPMRVFGLAPVAPTTNAHGVATFTVSSPVRGSKPIYFEAKLVKSTSGHPYGYSSILAVRFQS
jgi:hypothetical protein